MSSDVTHVAASSFKAQQNLQRKDTTALALQLADAASSICDVLSHCLTSPLS